jgi:hypothetical protein
MDWRGPVENKMIRTFNSYEKFLLAQPVKCLGLAALPDDATDIDYHERAYAWSVGVIGTDVQAFAKLWGVLPASSEERLALIHVPKD